MPDPIFPLYVARVLEMIFTPEGVYRVVGVGTLLYFGKVMFVRILNPKGEDVTARYKGIAAKAKEKFEKGQGKSDNYLSSTLENTLLKNDRFIQYMGQDIDQFTSKINKIKSNYELSRKINPDPNPYLVKGLELILGLSNQYLGKKTDITTNLDEYFKEGSFFEGYERTKEIVNPSFENILVKTRDELVKTDPNNWITTSDYINQLHHLIDLVSEYSNALSDPENAREHFEKMYRQLEHVLIREKPWMKPYKELLSN